MYLVKWYIIKNNEYNNSYFIIHLTKLQLKRVVILIIVIVNRLLIARILHIMGIRCFHSHPLCAHLRNIILYFNYSNWIAFVARVTMTPYFVLHEYFLAEDNYYGRFIFSKILYTVLLYCSLCTYHTVSITPPVGFSNR